MPKLANNRIGTSGAETDNAGERNVISGNVRNGVNIIGSGTSGNVVAGNSVGINAAGNAGLGNSGNGVHIAAGAANNRIGTDGSNSGVLANIIELNTLTGIDMLNDLVAGGILSHKDADFLLNAAALLIDQLES